MILFYCKSWFRAKKVAVDRWESDAAATAHAEGRTYTVLVNSAERPDCFIEVSRDQVSVGFLDDLLREKLSYSFQRVKDGRLFMTMAVYREFHGDNGDVTSGTMYIFKEDGSLHISKEQFSPHMLEATDGATDVSGNYASYPAFGEYEALTKIER